MSVLKRYNPSAYVNSTLDIHKSKAGCCGDPTAVCKYTLAATWNNVTAITLSIDGVNTVFTFADGAVTTPKALRMAVAAALKEAGYDPYYDDSYKGIVTTTTTMEIIGDAVVVSVTNNGSAVTADVACDIKPVYKWAGFVEYDTDPGFIQFGSAIGGSQIHDVGGFSSAEGALLASTMITAGDNAGYDIRKVEVSANDAFTGWNYIIHVEVDAEAPYVDGTLLTELGTYPDFI